VPSIALSYHLSYYHRMIFAGTPMTTESAVTTWVIEQLIRIAPEIDPAAVDAEQSFRDQFEFDSVDFLNFVLAAEDRIGRRIAEVDYPKLSSLKGCVSYLTPAFAPAHPPSQPSLQEWAARAG